MVAMALLHLPPEVVTHDCVALRSSVWRLPKAFLIEGLAKHVAERYRAAVWLADAASQPSALGDGLLLDVDD